MRGRGGRPQGRREGEAAGGGRVFPRLGLHPWACQAVREATCFPADPATASETPKLGTQGWSNTGDRRGERESPFTRVRRAKEDKGGSGALGSGRTHPQVASSLSVQSTTRSGILQLLSVRHPEQDAGLELPHQELEVDGLLRVARTFQDRPRVPSVQGDVEGEGALGRGRAPAAQPQ